jgi:DNA-directed RNA polymerase subunit H (RpoH/RPB5)
MALKTKITDQEIITKTILQNIKNMLNYRKTVKNKYINPINIYDDDDDYQEQEVEVIEDSNNNDVFIVDDVYILIMPVTISNISTTTKSIIGDFLKNTSIKHKIIVLKSPSKRVIQYIINSNPNFAEGIRDEHQVEVFTEVELMKDYNKIKFIPKHTIMSDSDIKNEIVENDINYLPIINSYDIMARWIGAIPNDIIKIVGYSITGGYRVTYRKVKYVLYS